MNVSDDEKRWIVFGIALNKVLVPKIRPFVEQEIRKEYQKLPKTIKSILRDTTGPKSTQRLLSNMRISIETTHSRHLTESMTIPRLTTG